MKIKAKKNEFQEPCIEATITIKVTAYLGENDETEIDEAVAKGLIQDRLSELASSNDGSELLANVGIEDIKFETE
jgi:hypothetical protein